MPDLINQLIDKNHTENVISFTREYLEKINKNIIPFLKLLHSENDKEDLNNVELQLNTLYINHKDYFQEIFRRTGQGFVKMLGDPHNNGKSTVVVEKSGDKIIYKPVNLDLLSLLNRGLNILNRSGILKFCFVTVIKKEKEYSVVKFINDEERENSKEFSFHYGALLFLITILRGLDIHRENVFCINSTPVIIDCESLFYPDIQYIKRYDIEATSMIPTKYHSFTPINFHKDHVKKIIEGIEVGYRIFINNKSDFLEIIDEGFKKQTRIIFKPTGYYYQILRNSTHPDFLLDIKKRKEYIVASLTGTHVISQTIINYEVEDLMNFDIPYFYFHEKKLCKGKNEINQNFIKSPKEDILFSIENIESFKNSMITVIRGIK